MYVTGSYRLTPRSTECKHLLKDSAFNSLQERICLQNSLGGGGGEQTHIQPSVYNQFIRKEKIKKNFFFGDVYISVNENRLPF